MKAEEPVREPLFYSNNIQVRKKTILHRTMIEKGVFRSSHLLRKHNNNNNVHLSCVHQHINLNMIFYTHVAHSPTKTIYIKY